jgi:hypothetical protein
MKFDFEIYYLNSRVYAINTQDYSDNYLSSTVYKTCIHNVNEVFKN